MCAAPVAFLRAENLGVAATVAAAEDGAQLADLYAELLRQGPVRALTVDTCLPLVRALYTTTRSHRAVGALGAAAHSAPLRPRPAEVCGGLPLRQPLRARVPRAAQGTGQGAAAHASVPAGHHGGRCSREGPPAQDAAQSGGGKSCQDHALLCRLEKRGDLSACSAAPRLRLSMGRCRCPRRRPPWGSLRSREPWEPWRPCWIPPFWTPRKSWRRPQRRLGRRTRYRALH